MPPPGKFVEIGPGSGEISKLLLMHGWTGIGIDLQSKAVDHLKNIFSRQIANGEFLAITGNFHEIFLEKVDLVISCNVMEHLSDDQEIKFLEKAHDILNPKGKFIAIVPSSMKFWSIEDEIAGHLRRYDRESLGEKLKTEGFNISHVAGITYPISNFLLPISSYLIKKNESYKLELSINEQTVLSGIRYVPYKTHFPWWVCIVLNSYILYPLHLLQKVFIKKINTLTLFYECTIKN